MQSYFHWKDNSDSFRTQEDAMASANESTQTRSSGNIDVDFPGDLVISLMRSHRLWDPNNWNWDCGWWEETFYRHELCILNNQDNADVIRSLSDLSVNVIYSSLFRIGINNAFDMQVFNIILNFWGFALRLNWGFTASADPRSPNPCFAVLITP